jgi:ribosomal protein S7
MPSQFIKKMILTKNLIRFNFNLKNSKQTTRINYSFFLKKYLKTINTLKFVNFYNKLTKNRRKFKRKTFRSFSNLLKDRKLSILLFKQYKSNNLLKRKRKKSKSKNTKKKTKLENQFKSNYYKNYLNRKEMVRKLFFFYVRKRKIKHSQHTNFLKFKNLFLKNGLVGKREILFFNILTSLKTLLKNKKIKLIKLLKIVFKRLTFFCELKKKRKFNNELLIPYPVSKRRGFFLGIKLLISNAKNRVENKLFYEKMALELFDTYYKKSATYKDLLKYNKMIRKNLDNVKLQKLSVFHYID